jgi:hypothetical protein
MKEDPLCTADVTPVIDFECNYNQKKAPKDGSAGRCELCPDFGWMVGNKIQICPSKMDVKQWILKVDFKCVSVLPPKPVNELVIRDGLNNNDIEISCGDIIQTRVISAIYRNSNDPKIPTIDCRSDLSSNLDRVFYSIKAVMENFKQKNLNELAIRYICVETTDDYFKYLVDNKIDLLVLIKGKIPMATNNVDYYPPETKYINCGKYYYDILSARYYVEEQQTCTIIVAHTIHEECNYKQKLSPRGNGTGCEITPDFNWLAGNSTPICTKPNPDDRQQWLLEIVFRCVIYLPPRPIIEKVIREGSNDQ